MRREFLRYPMTAAEAKACCLWAVITAVTNGGYVCFESYKEYLNWMANKTKPIKN